MSKKLIAFIRTAIIVVTTALVIVQFYVANMTLTIYAETPYFERFNNTPMLRLSINIYMVLLSLFEIFICTFIVLKTKER